MGPWIKKNTPRPPMCHAHAASNSKFKLQTSNYEQTEKKEKKMAHYSIFHSAFKTSTCSAGA